MMKKLNLILIFVVIFVINSRSQIIFAPYQKGEENLKLGKKEKYLNNTADLAKFGKLKITSRKTRYSVNEMMDLDVALWVKSNEVYYLPINLDIKVMVKSSQEASIEAKPVMYVDFYSDKFLQSKDALVIRYYNILIGGVNSDLDKILNEDVKSDENKEIFENNLFKNILYSYIEIQKPEVIEITAELSNNIVVLSRKNSTKKTLTGKIKSNTLKIKIE
jgi:hypothetical protein